MPAANRAASRRAPRRRRSLGLLAVDGGGAVVIGRASPWMVSSWRAAVNRWTPQEGSTTCGSLATLHSRGVLFWIPWPIRPAPWSRSSSIFRAIWAGRGYRRTGLSSAQDSPLVAFLPESRLRSAAGSRDKLAAEASSPYSAAGRLPTHPSTPVPRPAVQLPPQGPARRLPVQTPRRGVHPREHQLGGWAHKACPAQQPGAVSPRRDPHRIPRNKAGSAGLRSSRCSSASGAWIAFCPPGRARKQVRKDMATPLHGRPSPRRSSPDRAAGSPSR